MTTTRPGWFPDPTGRFTHRFHNGRAWTADVAVDGRRFVDPMGADTSDTSGTPGTSSAPEPGRNGPAIASLVLGIIAVTIAWLPFLVVLGVLAAGAAIAFGVVGLRRSTAVGTGRSFAVVGLVTGGTAVAAAVLGVILTVVVLDEIDAYRNPAAYEIRTVDCGVDDGTATFVGELTNVDDRTGAYAVLVTFVRPSTDNSHRRARVSVDDVAPGATERFEVRRAITLDHVDCLVARVDGPLPFGLALD